MEWLVKLVEETKKLYKNEQKRCFADMTEKKKEKNMSENPLVKLYGRLKGIESLVISSKLIGKSLIDDYNEIVFELAELLKEDLKSFHVNNIKFCWIEDRNEYLCYKESIIEKLIQLLSYLDHGFTIGSSSMSFGELNDAISDDELKNRCIDILSAVGNYDRVINQATLVLEDRIRKKSRLSGIGTNLVSNAISSDIHKSKIVISENKEEHEGISHICRGILLAFRNPTHHYISKEYSKEDAVKVCCFIDALLKMIDSAEVKPD